MGDDHDFADAEFLEKLDKVEMEALMVDGPHVPSAEGAGFPSSSVLGFGRMGESSVSGSGSGSYVIVHGGKKPSSSDSASAPIISSSKKAIEHLDIIEIESSDEDDEMLGTDDKENEPVATRHVKRRTEDLDEGMKETGRGLFANQGWNPPLNGGSSGRRNGGLGIQSQDLIQGLKPRVLGTRPDDVIDLSDSDND